MKSYVIRKIPDELWRQVRMLAAERSTTIRELLINMIIKETKQGDN